MPRRRNFIRLTRSNLHSFQLDRKRRDSCLSLHLFPNHERTTSFLSSITTLTLAFMLNCCRRPLYLVCPYISSASFSSTKTPPNQKALLSSGRPDQFLLSQNKAAQHLPRSHSPLMLLRRESLWSQVGRLLMESLARESHSLELPLSTREHFS